jgi:ABC-2 type transport system permease protein
MNQIIAMTRKELLLWAKKPGSWIIVFVVPLLFIWIVGSVFGENGTPVVTIYAVNADDSQEARQVMRALRNFDNLKLEELETRQEADRRVGTGERMAAVIVPEGFGSALLTKLGAKVEIIVDPARSEQACGCSWVGAGRAWANAGGSRSQPWG